MSVDVTYFRIERMMKSGAECFLCALEDEIERKYIDAYLSEFVMDAKAREKLVENLGFCNHHFYKMLITATKPESSDGHGVALITKSIIEKLLQDLQERKKNCKEHFSQIRREENCPACVHLTTFMEIYIKKAVELLSSRNEEFLKLLKDSKGLCIPHFITLLKMLENTMHNQDLSNTLIETEEKSLLLLKSELSEYIRRQSYEFSNENRRAVEDVLLRSIQKIVGRRGRSLGNV